MFIANGTLTVTSLAWSVATADFDGDGDLDLAVTNPSSNLVSVLLGNGAGGFGGPTTYAVGSGPYGLAIGDFNGDGDPDLVTANANANSYSILLGSTGGTFSAAVTTAGGLSLPQAVRVGDLNGDGKQDLVFANQGSDTISVRLGDGAGGFIAGPGSPFAVGDEPYDVALGDIDGDGDLDAVVANFSGDTIYALLGNGAGGFGAATNIGASGGVRTVALGDLNGDGHLDVVAGSQDSGVSVLLGDGAGHFSGAAIAGGFFVSLADLNGDGRLDLVGKLENGGFTVQLGDGAGGFGAGSTFLANDDTLVPAIGDFNGDGRPDLAMPVYTGGAGQVRILLNAGLSIAVDSPATRQEGDGGSTAFTFTVTRYGVTSGAATVDWAVTGSGAHPAIAADFAGGVLPSGTVSFANGESSKTITVQVAGDGGFETDEGFTVTLANPTGGFSVTTAAATATIANDDRAPPGTPPPITVSGVGTDGDDTVMLKGVEAHRFAGGGGSDFMVAGDGGDWLHGNMGRDTLSGGAGADTLYGGRDDDLMNGGDGGDWMSGDLGDDRLNGWTGADRVQGGEGADTCDGGAGDDTVRGGQGNDEVRGGTGDDWLSGDKGDDTVSGGAGADVFHLSEGAGLDRVTDFNFAEGDRIQLDPGTAYSAAQVGADTVITLHAGQMVLAGVTLATLADGWIFGS